MLGEYLKRYRIKNNLTQCDMADKLKTSQSYYNQLENNRLKPGFKLINRIADVLKISVGMVRDLL